MCNRAIVIIVGIGAFAAGCASRPVSSSRPVGYRRHQVQQESFIGSMRRPKSQSPNSIVYRRKANDDPKPSVVRLENGDHRKRVSDLGKTSPAPSSASQKRPAQSPESQKPTLEKKSVVHPKTRQEDDAARGIGEKGGKYNDLKEFGFIP